MKKLREDVARLTDLVASLQTDRRRSHSKSRRACSPAPSNDRRARSPAPPNDSTFDSLCWYHAKYGSKAEKCREPYSWENAQAGH